MRREAQWRQLQSALVVRHEDHEQAAVEGWDGENAEVCAEPVDERHTLGCLHCPPESGYTCFPCILDIVEPHAEEITAQLLERDGDQKTCMLEHTPDDETCSTCVYNGRPTLMCNVLRMLQEGVEEFSQLV